MPSQLNQEFKMSEETSSHPALSDAEVQTRLENELPHWTYENGWTPKNKNKRLEIHVNGRKYGRTSR
jgi:hypothetical protein